MYVGIFVVRRRPVTGFSARMKFPFIHPQMSLSLVKRAENAGFKALVVTVDLPILGIRLNDHRNKFKPPLNPANFDMMKERGNVVARIAKEMIDASLTWNDIAWLKSQTTLPLVLKGDLHFDKLNRVIIISTHVMRTIIFRDSEGR